MTDDTESKALFKIAAELQKEIRDMKHDDDAKWIELLELRKKVSSLECFIEELKIRWIKDVEEYQGYEEDQNKRLINIETFLKQNYRIDIDALKSQTTALTDMYKDLSVTCANLYAHKNRQIDENRAVDRKLDELESMIKAIFNLLAK